MRWGMHLWFLSGMLLSGVITFLLFLMVLSIEAAVAVFIGYVVVSSLLLWCWFRRRGDRRLNWRSRELRCKWPTNPSLRFRRIAPPRRAAVLLAID
jgi:membrane protein implicated in regulation of membrane protease activity